MADAVCTCVVDEEARPVSPTGRQSADTTLLPWFFPVERFNLKGDVVLTLSFSEPTGLRLSDLSWIGYLTA